MGEAVGKILFVILALVVISIVASIALSILGFALALIPILIKLAIFGGIIYLGWMVFTKLTKSSQTF
jgi:arginine exporter protein ArgO